MTSTSVVLVVAHFFRLTHSTCTHSEPTNSRSSLKVDEGAQGLFANDFCRLGTLTTVPCTTHAQVHVFMPTFFSETARGGKCAIKNIKHNIITLSTLFWWGNFTFPYCLWRVKSSRVVHSPPRCFKLFHHLYTRHRVDSRRCLPSQKAEKNWKTQPPQNAFDFAAFRFPLFLFHRKICVVCALFEYVKGKSSDDNDREFIFPENVVSFWEL